MKSNADAQSDSTLRARILELEAFGWREADFRKNHLEYVASQNARDWNSPLRIPFNRYWRTVARISSILQREGIFHVIIKTRRHHPYTDTNVDVFVTEADSKSVQRLLCADTWIMPSRPVILKQRMIERAKLKLPARDSRFVPAHLYMSVSWRYQREVTFLEPGMIEQVPIRTEAPELVEEFGPLMIPMPTRPADILLHCAEIVFENYRLTLGEALYVSWLLGQVSDSDRDAVLRAATERGAGVAVRCIIERVESALSEESSHGLDPDWPKNLSRSELLSSWGERLRFQANHSRMVSGVEEWLGYSAFSSMYWVKRRWFE